MTDSESTYSQPPDYVPAYMRRWRRLKRLGLMRECAILQDNEVTGRGFAVGIAAFVVTLFLVVGSIVTVVSIAQCSTFGHEYRARTHWTALAGCFVQLPNGRSVTTGQLRATELLNR